MASRKTKLVHVSVRVPGHLTKQDLKRKFSLPGTEVKRIRTPIKATSARPKGRGFERDFAAELSLWWTADQDKHVFAPRMASGAARRDTKGHSGAAADIHADKAIGEQFINRWAVECKFYADATPDVWLFMQGSFSARLHGDWQQVITAAAPYDRYSLLVVRTNNRKPLIFTDDIDLVRLVTAPIASTQHWHSLIEQDVKTQCTFMFPTFGLFNIDPDQLRQNLLGDSLGNNKPDTVSKRFKRRK